MAAPATKTKVATDPAKLAAQIAKAAEEKGNDDRMARDLETLSEAADDDDELPSSHYAKLKSLVTKHTDIKVPAGVDCGALYGAIMEAFNGLF